MGGVGRDRRGGRADQRRGRNYTQIEGREAKIEELIETRSAGEQSPRKVGREADLEKERERERKNGSQKTCCYYDLF